MRFAFLPGAALEPPPASFGTAASGQPVLVVPSGGSVSSMFDPSFWSAFNPLAFPYGDGVFGLERDATLSYQEWGQCVLFREELVYESIFD